MNFNCSMCFSKNGVGSLEDRGSGVCRWVRTSNCRFSRIRRFFHMQLAIVKTASSSKAPQGSHSSISSIWSASKSALFSHGKNAELENAPCLSALGRLELLDFLDLLTSGVL